MLPSVPTGTARVFYVVGLIVAFAGIAIGMFAIVTTVAEGFRFDPNDPAAVEPDFSRVGRLLPVAFGLAVPGLIVVGLSSAIGSRPAPGNSINVTRGIVTTGSGNTTVRDALNDRNVTNIFVPAAALHELHAVQQIVANLRLPSGTGHHVQGYLGQAEWELQQARPNADWIGDRIMRATNLVQQTGALAQAGSDLVPRLARLASFLGDAGDDVLDVLS